MIESLSPAQYAAWADGIKSGTGQSPVLLDVREPWELSLAQVKPEHTELHHIPMQSVPQWAQSFDKNRCVAVLCHHGVRSMHVARYLDSLGFTKLYNVTGGIDAWATGVDAKIGLY